MQRYWLILLYYLTWRSNCWMFDALIFYFKPATSSFYICQHLVSLCNYLPKGWVSHQSLGCCQQLQLLAKNKRLFNLFMLMLIPFKTLRKWQLRETGQMEVSKMDWYILDRVHFKCGSLVPKKAIKNWETCPTLKGTGDNPLNQRLQLAAKFMSVFSLEQELAWRKPRCLPSSGVFLEMDIHLDLGEILNHALSLSLHCLCHSTNHHLCKPKVILSPLISPILTQITTKIMFLSPRCTKFLASPSLYQPAFTCRWWSRYVPKFGWKEGKEGYPYFPKWNPHPSLPL